MKLNKLRITNYKWHRDREINHIPKYLIITGPNACGKTSIVDALCWNLVGVTKQTSASGAGADKMVLDGEGRAVVESEIQTQSGVHTIKRSIPHTLEVDGTRGGVKRTTELLNTILSPVTSTALLHTFEGHRILSMSDSDRKKLFASVVGVLNRTDEQTLIDLRAWLATQGTTEDELRDVLREHENVSPKDYKGFYEARRANNSLLNSLKDIPDEFPGEEQQGPALESLYSRQAMLDLELKLAEKMNPDGKSNPTAIVNKPDLEKIRGKLSNLRSMLSTLEKAASAKQERIGLAESQRNQISSAAHQCPFFMKECPLPKEEVNEALEQTESIQIRFKKELSADNRRITMTQKALEGADQELVDAEKEIDEYSNVWATGETHTFERVRAPEEIKKDLLKIKGIIEEAIKRQTQITAGTALRIQIQQKATAKLRVNPLETLVQGFAPTGITTMLLMHHLPRLEELATAASREITNNRYEITFSVENGELDVSVVSDNKRRDLGSLSTSEEIWVSFIIQHVINSYIGNRILVIDEAATLDARMQEGLQHFLHHTGCLCRGAEDQYDTIIICATTNNGDQFLPGLPEDQVLRYQLGGTHEPARTN